MADISLLSEDLQTHSKEHLVITIPVPRARYRARQLDHILHVIVLVMLLRRTHLGLPVVAPIEIMCMN